LYAKGKLIKNKFHEVNVKDSKNISYGQPNRRWGNRFRRKELVAESHSLNSNIFKGEIL
jgi:hypothetical protein